MSESGSIPVNNYQRQVDLIDIASRGQNKPAVQKAAGETFKEMFSRELATQRNVSFSKHAHQRLFSRGIELSEENLNGLVDAIDKAAAKGSKDTLILAEQAAFVVDVVDRKVVTVFDRDNLNEGVVTSIDSAVII